jgi:hypothetical protein
MWGGAYSKLCLCSSTSLPREREEEGGGPKISKTRHNYALSFPFFMGAISGGQDTPPPFLDAFAHGTNDLPSSYLPTPPHEHRHKPKEKYTNK